MSTKQILIEQSVSPTGIITYSTEIMHRGLGKHRRIKDRDQSVVVMRAQTQLEQWAAQWAKQQAREKATQKKERAQKQAALRTQIAAKRLTGIENTLKHTLSHDDTVDWDSLKDHSAFPEPGPSLKPPQEPLPRELPPEPDMGSMKYQAKISFWDAFSSKRSALRKQEAQNLYTVDQRAWQDKCSKIQRFNEQLQTDYKAAVIRTEKDHRRRVREWEERRAQFRSKQGEQNKKINQRRADWQAGKRAAVETYCDMVLSGSQYDECCPQEFELEYSDDNGILIVDYQLPAPDALPTLMEVKYVISRKEFVEKHLPQTKQRKLYDDLLYQISLRTVHELFEADTARSLAAVVFNGYVTSIDKRTGKKATACVLSVQADREALGEMDLKHVDPKACFRALSGVGSAKLHSITPVAPLQTLSRDDARFVADQAVVEGLDEGDNLAAMDWEDFEHLIREVFAKEFSGDGGEVRVTQASRDGGVDAIAFDPDPIRGGKIVIQAKRYTNVVGVSAVRDLYGTVMNEGAMKGILVTTSNYGPDAHKFAADKPLTLLDGGHLLHILDRHGHKAKIDLAEAKLLNDGS